MSLAGTPIQRKLMTILLLTSGTVLLLTCAAFFAYEFLTSRQTMVRQLSTLGKIIADNSTAALAFDNQDDAKEILATLKADQHIVAACLYDKEGNLFSQYPKNLPVDVFPAAPENEGYRFESSHLITFYPVVEGSRRLGALYLKSDMGAMYERFRLYSVIVLVVIGASFLVAYTLSKALQGQISQPILALAETAKAISDRQDYSVRAVKLGQDELGLLTDAFNHMLTQIHEQNQALKDSEERVRAVLNSALSAVVAVDSEDKIIEWNAQAEKLFGWTHQEALGRSLSATIVPLRYREANRRGLERFLATGESPIVNRLMEMNLLRRDGSEFPVELFISSLKIGGMVTFCGFLTDITERKEAETKLQAQLSRLDLLSRTTHAIGERQDLRSIFQVVIRSLEDNLPIDFGCICLYDSVTEMLTVTSVGVRSGALAMELAMSEQAHIPIEGNGLARCVRGQLVYEPDISEVRMPFLQRLANAGLHALVAAPLLVESRVFGVLLSARRQAHSFSSGECEFLRQLSEHVALATHQAQLYTALQQAYDDLRQTQQAVLQQERLRALGQMASGIAHDINNAISPIALYTESLLEQDPNLSPSARERLEIIQRAIEDVAHTVARMREFYRQREPQLALLPVDLTRLLPQVVDLTRARWSDIPQQQGRVITIHTALAPVPPILGVESELREAFVNLVFNAVDAMPEGGMLTLRARMGGARDTLASVQVEVCDTGIGMDDETRRKCLEPFFTTKGERGTGLGLAMVYGIVQRHGAELEIESAIGKGTTIRLIFTAPTAAAQATSLPVVQGSASVRLRLLIVDDDPLLLKSLRDTLEADGHLITAADGGQAGVDAFVAAHTRGEPFVAVITDLGMPYMDGRQVAAAIKATASATPVLLLTGWGQRLTDEQDLPPHVDRVLSKPPKLRELRTALAELTAGIGQTEQ
ncbi:MAG: PAS domain S-box protein [Candidatus Binatia bacterium]